MLLEIINWIRKFTNSDLGLTLGFINLLIWIFGIIRLSYKKALGNIHTIKGIALITAMLSIGLVIPLIILIFSDWSTGLKIVMNSLAIFCLFSFIFLFYITKKMGELSRNFENEKIAEESTVGLRATHEFFKGELKIFLADQIFIGNPMEHKITARVWSPDFEEIVIQKQGVGFSINYVSNANYRIRITKAEINRATFQVTKNSIF